ncbi:MAG: hypothetical protein WGN25_09495 [Candidatus Electrothrix sp. GW3-4]|uniref:hypothetical protein n=1 Tax=Candidatus Electrothrix sp. GW3-4 TaxID=3126740 RepID=UPI0030D38A55
MKKYNQVVPFILLVLCALWVPNAFAALSPHSAPDLSALTVKEADAKYGVGSGYEQPFVFEVNAEVGNSKCVSIGPDCSKACPTAKIYYQSPQHYLNRDGSSTMKVDIYFDNNDPITSRDPSC